LRLTTKGQITIPQAIREKLGLMPMTEVEFDIVGDSVRIRKKASGSAGKKSRGQLMLEAMKRAPRPKPGMTTDELMALTRGE
jgi:AbrB family looped-hinge helix DNA binding protein